MRNEQRKHVVWTMRGRTLMGTDGEPDFAGLTYWILLLFRGLRFTLLLGNRLLWWLLGNRLLWWRAELLLTYFTHFLLAQGGRATGCRRLTSFATEQSVFLRGWWGGSIQAPPGVC